MIPQKYTLHPWHGIPVGEDAPNMLNCFIEMVPTDTVKYEVDKETGYLMIDRPQKFSNIVPALYGFIPQTYCGESIAEYCMEKTGRTGIVGDGDPLDICVFTEKDIPHGNILVHAKPIGGFRMIDGGEADDKIVAVLKGDEIYKDIDDLANCSDAIIDRLRHYFLTYKYIPGEQMKRVVEITHIYGRDEAVEVINRSLKDYDTLIGR